MADGTASAQSAEQVCLVRNGGSVYGFVELMMEGPIPTCAGRCQVGHSLVVAAAVGMASESTPVRAVRTATWTRSVSLVFSPLRGIAYVAGIAMMRR